MNECSDFGSLKIAPSGRFWVGTSPTGTDFTV